MADRGPPPAYTGRPNNFAMFANAQGLPQQLPHQQLQQQGPQQDAHQQMPFSDPTRMWPMQGQGQAPQDQFRGQPQNQIANQHMSQQMVEMLRNQSVNRIAQPAGTAADFSVGPPHMGGVGMQGPHQQFHDQHQHQHQPQPGQPQQHAHMPNSAFPPPHNPTMHAASFNNRAAMLNALQNGHNPSHVRQLELINLAQNQQNQNSPINVNRMMPPQQMHGQGGGDFFNGMAGDAPIRRNSPLPPNAPQHNPMQSQQGAPQNHTPRGVPAGLAELAARINQVRESLGHSDNQIKHLQANRAGTSDQQFLERMRVLQTEALHKRDIMTKLVNIYRTAQANGGQLNPAVMQQVTRMAPAGQQNPGAWPNQNNQAQLQHPFSNANGMNQPPPSHSPPLASPPHRAAQSTPLMAHPPPPRPIPTPQQMLSKPNFSQQASPNMGPQFPAGNQGQMQPDGSRPALPSASQIIQALQATGSPVVPLEKDRFENAFQSYLQNRKLVVNPHDLNIDGKSVDLYALHSTVLDLGGVQKVDAQDQWAVVAGRVGFVNFPGVNEPPRSGPATASKVAMIYKSYLIHFDYFYLNSVLDSRRKMQRESAMAVAQGNLPMNGGLPPDQQQPVKQLNLNLRDPQASYLHGLADFNIAELKARGVPEEQIVFIEKNRQAIKAMSMDQSFPQQMRSQRAIGGGPPDPKAMQQAGAAGQPLQRNGAMGPLPNQPMQHPMQQGSVPGPSQGGDKAPSMIGPIGKPTKENLQMAHNLIGKFRAEFSREKLPGMKQVEGHPEGKASYLQMLDPVCQMGLDIEQKLPMLLLAGPQNIDYLRKVVYISQACQHQRSIIMQGGPNARYILSLDNLRSMNQTLREASQRWQPQFQQLAMMMKQHQEQQRLAQQNGGSMGGPPPGPQGPLTNGGTMAQRPQTSPQPPPNQLPPAKAQPHATQMPPPAQQPNRPSNLHPPPVPASGTKKLSISQSSGGPASSPASAPTPVANAPTPMNVSSPQTPKSPRTKAPPKPKAQSKRKPSKAANTPAAEPATPATAPSPGAGSKRPREEETAPTPVPPTPDAAVVSTPAAAPVVDEPSPPKRVKTDSEWDGSVSDAVIQKQQAVENISTDEEASAFLQTMSEFFRSAGDGPDGTALVTNMAAEFSTLLKGVGAPVDMPEASTSALPSFGEAKREPSPQPTVDDAEFAQFFDFTSFVDDNASKAPTPELVSSSSTNPSPESGSDSDPHQAHSGDVKSEESSEPLRLGAFKEIDGGESAYFTMAGDWKWEGSMPALEQPWAIFPST